MTRYFTFPLLCLMTLMGSAWGHPGHGTTPPESVQHYTSEPEHVAPILVGVVVVLGLGYVMREKWMGRK